MKRRDFLGWLESVFVALLAFFGHAVSGLVSQPTGVAKPERITIQPNLPNFGKFGFISATTRKDLLGKVTIYCDGVDVTDNCVAADDRRGVVWSRIRNQQGSYVLRFTRPDGTSTITRPGPYLPHGWKQELDLRVTRGQVRIVRKT